MVIVFSFSFVHCRQRNSFYYVLGFGLVERSCPRERAKKPAEKQDNFVKTEPSHPRIGVKIEVIIPVTVEKKMPTGEVDVARTAEFPTVQALADFANKTSSALVEVKLVPVEATLAAEVEVTQPDTQATEAAEEARQQSPTPHTIPQQSPSRDSAEWTIIDDVEKSNASAAAVITLVASSKSPPQQTQVEKVPLHPGNLSQDTSFPIFD